MNPSTAFATVLVDELIRCGVREAVLCPGSRSAPLAYALQEADRAGRLRLHVRIDERSAGFLALGLAKGGRGSAVAIVTTSGTAVANLHPAVLEAHHSGVPLVVLTADRPPELRDTGANQTTDQIKIFGSAVRLFHEVGVPEVRVGQVAYWRALVCRALAAATGALSRDPGPVHLNVAFREPLVPDVPSRVAESLSPGLPGNSLASRLADEVGDWIEPLAGRAGGDSWSEVRPAGAAQGGRPLRLGPRTVVLAGDAAGLAARQVAERAGWPLLAEPTSGVRSGPNAIATYRLLLGAPPEVSGLAADIERVIVFGRPTLSRPVTRLLSRDDVEIVVVSDSVRWPDVGRRAARVVSAVTIDPAGEDGPASDLHNWLQRWLDADALARKAIDAILAEHPISGPAIAQAVATAVPPGGLLIVGSSNPIRDLDLAPAWDDQLLDPLGSEGAWGPRSVLGNRGVSGIDGTVSTAIGAALAVSGGSSGRPRSYALMGDLTFLHDSNGLLIGPDEPRPDLCIVVVNDDGGGIFSVLEQGSPKYQGAFERVFGTPHGVDLAALCAAAGTSYQRADDLASLAGALEPQPGLRVLEVRLVRAHRRDLNRQLTEAVNRALETS